MELRDIRAFIGIAETGSLSAAAKKGHLTQPALTAALRRLEDELGVSLVQRHSRGVHLTDEGRFVLQKAYDIVQDANEICSVSQGFTEEPVGPVSLGIPTSIAAGLVPELLPKIRAHFPRIRLKIVEMMSGVLSELLQLGRLDSALLFDVQPMAGLRTTPILREKHFLLVSNSHPLANRTTVRLEEVSRLPLVLPSESNSIRRLIETSCRAEGLTLDVIADIDSYPGLFNLVRTGHCTIFTSFLAVYGVNAGSIVPVEITRPTLEWTVHLATRHDATRPRASMAVNRLLIDTCRELVEARKWPGEIVTR